MISEFQTRFAEVLGERLPAPFSGRVHVAPAPEGPGNPTVPALRVGVTEARPRPTGIGGGDFTQVVKGANAPRRVLALQCTVRVEVFPLASDDAAGRAAQMQLLESAAFQLGAADMRNGAALEDQDTPDPGFLVHKLHLNTMHAPFGAELEDEDPEPSLELRLDLEGWFWPVGQPGVSGTAIQETRVRGVSLPLALEAAAALTAGGAAVDFVLRLGPIVQPRAASQLDPDFQSLALSVDGGSISSADALPGSTAQLLLINVSDGAAAFSITPPAEAGRIDLRAAFDDGDGGAGLQFAEFRLVVGEAP